MFEIVPLSRHLGEESEALLERLCEATERPEHIYEHQWRVGDVLIWDNRAVLHARTDFDGPELKYRFGRNLERLTGSDVFGYRL